MIERPSPKVRLYEKVRIAILKEWDPIGISDIAVAQDEYDSYVPAICKVVREHKNRDEVFEYLWAIETGRFGLRGNRQKTEQFTDRLIDIAQQALREAASEDREI